jgi:hypothetical protein
MWYEDAVCGGRESAFSGCVRAIGGSTVPLGRKAEETATGMRISSSRHLKNWKPIPRFRFRSPPLYVD